MNHKKQNKNQNGFTLIELLITVLILGILATISYPTYQSYILNGRLESARSDLLANTRVLESYYARHHTFTELNVELNKTSDSEIALKQNEYFNISVDQANTTADDYVLRADPNSDKNPNEKRFLMLESGSVVACTPLADIDQKSCVAF